MKLQNKLNEFILLTLNEATIRYQDPLFFAASIRLTRVKYPLQRSVVCLSR